MSLKAIFYVALAGGIFYSGILFERKYSKVGELQQKCVEMSTLDYKIRSLIEEKAKDPQKVEDALRKYENTLR